MRPSDRGTRWIPPVDGGFNLLDADLETLDAELEAAGAHARKALHGQTQPTRFFAGRLRGQLLASFEAAATPAAGPRSAASRAAAAAAPIAATPIAASTSASGSAAASFPMGHGRQTGVRPDLTTPGETWAPTPLEPRIARRTPTVMPRARWALVAAAALTGAIAAGTLGAKLDWILPPPSPDPSIPAIAVDRTARPSMDPSPAPVITVPTAQPTSAPDPSVAPDRTPRPTRAPATEKPQPTPTPTPTPTPKPTPTPRPTPKPTPKPDPTKPPILSMDFMAKACPGGVLLDWTKPSPEVGHYHVLRSLGGDVPPTYPADGTTEIDSATSFDAGVTDGFDATISGGDSASYRAFAFDGEDGVMAHSSSRTVTTIARKSLGALSVTDAGPGSIDVSWAAAGVNAACFSYGKLVASIDDPEPSYLDGSSAWAVVESLDATGTHLDGLQSGKTVWMRYEVIRATSLGKFVVARTDAVQVTVP